MDPIGFALENFDAIGRWRTADDGAPIDPSGTLFDGTRIDGPAELRDMLAARPEIFVGVMTEKLLTYALGRGLEYYDMPTVRKIVRDAEAQDYRFSALIMGIVNSPAVSDEESRGERATRAVGDHGEIELRRCIHDVYHQETSAAPNIPAWCGRDDGAAAAGFHGSGANAIGENGRQAAIPAGTLLHPARRGDGQLDSGRPRARISRFRERWRRWRRSRINWWWSAAWRTRWPRPAGPGDNGGDHTRSPTVFLSGVHPKRTDGADIRAGVTIDQMAAQKIGQETALPSLELATEDYSGLVGSCDVGFSCAYMNTISWRTPTTPLPMEINPRVVFDRLFGDGATAEERLERIRQERSILDAVTGQVRRLEGNLPANDRNRVAEYLDTVREIERRIQLAEKQHAIRAWRCRHRPAGFRTITRPTPT